MRFEAIIGSGIAGTLIAYPLMYYALSHRYKASLSNTVNLVLVAMNVPVAGIAGAALGHEPSSPSPLGTLALFVGSLATSFVVIGAAFEIKAARARGQSDAAGSEGPLRAYLRRFSRPVERAAFVLMALGICALLAGLVAFWSRSGFDFHELKYDLREIFLEQARFGREWMSWLSRVGLVVALIGYSLAYHYDRTAGLLLRAVNSLVRWVRTGQ